MKSFRQSERSGLRFNNNNISSNNEVDSRSSSSFICHSSQSIKIPPKLKWIQASDTVDDK